MLHLETCDGCGKSHCYGECTTVECTTVTLKLSKWEAEWLLHVVGNTIAVGAGLGRRPDQFRFCGKRIDLEDLEGRIEREVVR